MNTKTKPITQEQLAKFLGSYPRDPRKDTPEINEDYAERLLYQFSAKSIYDKLLSESVSISWIIRELVRLYNEECDRVSDKITLLDRLKEYVLLGAIQDPKFIESLDASTKDGTTLSDPFVQFREPRKKLEVSKPGAKPRRKKA
jgi:hypothetical protein